MTQSGHPVAGRQRKRTLLGGLVNVDALHLVRSDSHVAMRQIHVAKRQILVERTAVVMTSVE
jgi:hypothetical protein